MIEETFKACIDKVRLGLRCCIELCAQCGECPYNVDDFRFTREDMLKRDALDILNFLSVGVSTFEFHIIRADEQR